MKFLVDALTSLAPKAKWVIEGSHEYANIQWDPSNTISKPTENQILDEVAKFQAEYDSTEYQRLRSVEYPTIQHQLDMQYWDSVNGTTTWQDAINAVKAKYPKP